MADGIIKYEEEEADELYSKIANLINSRKTAISQALNAAMLFLYWEIGEAICLDVLNHTKADYGKGVVDEVSDRLTREYWKGFNRTSGSQQGRFLLTHFLSSGVTGTGSATHI